MLQKVDATEILLCAMMYKVSDKDLLRPFFKIGAMKLACSVVEGRHTMRFHCAHIAGDRHTMKFFARNVAEGRQTHTEICRPQCWKR